jgi:uncharacterized protein YwgA
LTEHSQEKLTAALSRRALVLGGLLRRVGNFNMMRSFRDRLIFQKTTYLLQAFGVYLGYGFSWYIYGPYSPSLTKDGFSILPVYPSIAPFHFSSPEAEQRFEKFVSFLGSHKNDAIWLEAVASVHSLRKLYPNLSQDEIVGRVATKQPYFSRRDAELAWSSLRSASLIA